MNMFRMQEVGRKIAARRKELNLTQMELADRMGVSFQAVSNWERGNSMPDIGKLPELSSLLQLSIDELLTDEKPARLIKHILDGDEARYIKEEAVKADTVAEVAPILKPDQAERLVKAVLSERKDAGSLKDVAAVAPYVSDDFLHHWAMRIDAVEDMDDLAALAPFLSEETLDLLCDKLSGTGVSPRKLVPLAPFLSEQSLNKLVLQALDGAGWNDLVALAPFLSDEALGEVVARMGREKDVHPEAVLALAPFLPEKALDALALALADTAKPENFVALAPFLSAKALSRCADKLAGRFGVKGILPIAPFLR